MKSKLGGRSSPLATGPTAPQTTLGELSIFLLSKLSKVFHAYCVSDLDDDMTSIHSHFLD